MTVNRPFSRPTTGASPLLSTNVSRRRVLAVGGAAALAPALAACGGGSRPGNTALADGVPQSSATRSSAAAGSAPRRPCATSSTAWTWARSSAAPPSPGRPGSPPRCR
ncbi:hypothetical protein ACR6C2_43775 [Streptomyces sp. INA 01156]